MIDRETIGRIFDAADIVEVISDFVQLKKAGSNYKGLSPFVNEKTPSFMVSPSKGIFKDFSSGKGGNVVSFLMEVEKLSYPDALRFLAKKYNIEILEKEKTEEDIIQENERESLLVISSFANKFFINKLTKNAEGKAIALKYLQERGVRENMIEKFQLGYNPDYSTALTDELLKNEFKKEYIVSSGLASESNGKLFDRFRGRIIFPIHGLSGSVQGFGGRTLRTDKNVAKYLNSPESEIYHKSRILYGLYFAKKSIITRDRCYLVEGYTDVISFHQAGIENVVASSGTALTVEQIRLIKRFTPNVTIIYDGDEAGIKASFRGIDLVLEEGLNIRVLLLPDGEDPDSFSRKKSSGELIEYIEKHEQDFISFKTGLLLKDADKDPVKKANLVNDILRSVSMIPEAINRSVYIRECSTILNMDERILHSEVNKLRRNKLDQKWSSRPATEEHLPREIPSQPQVPAFVESVYSEYEERDVLNFLLRYGNDMLNLNEEEGEISVARYIIREIQNDELEIENLVYKKVFETVQELLENGKQIEDKYFVYHDDRKIQDLAVDIFTEKHEISKIWQRKDSFIEMPGDNPGTAVPKALLAYKSRIITKAIKETGDKIAKASREDNLEKIRELQSQFISLKEIQILISKQLGARTIISP
ncbi:MAG: DNA primase [Bacteroidales bacterium]|nr:DNA primase [Bacteroidales bacterium]MCF8389626.1 DNA primase [Bacteroidales bacterium]